MKVHICKDECLSAPPNQPLISVIYFIVRHCKSLMTHMFTYLTSPRNGEANGEDSLEAHGLIFVSAI